MSVWVLIKFTFVNMDFLLVTEGKYVILWNGMFIFQITVMAKSRNKPSHFRLLWLSGLCRYCTMNDSGLWTTMEKSLHDLLFGSAFLDFFSHTTDPVDDPKIQWFSDEILAESSVRDEEDDTTYTSYSVKMQRQIKALPHDCIWAGECAELLKSLAVEMPHDSGVHSTEICVCPTPVSQSASRKTNFAENKMIRPTPALRSSSHQTTSVTGPSSVQTPSDSEEEVDVVTVYEVRDTAAASLSSPTSGVSLPVKLKSNERRPMVIFSFSSLALVVDKLFLFKFGGSTDCLCYGPVTGPTQRTSSSATVLLVRKEPLTRPPALSKASKRPPNDDDRWGSSTPRTESESPVEKRSQHNIMERQRRDGLRNAFNALQSLVPCLKAKQRVSKVNTLRKATHTCQKLKQIEQHYVNEEARLRKRQKMLRQRLALLQRRSWSLCF